MKKTTCECPDCRGNSAYPCSEAGIVSRLHDRIAFLSGSVSKLEEANKEAAIAVGKCFQASESWQGVAMQAQRNCDYYRDIVVQVGRILGPVSTIADDGSVPGGVLCAKVPELVQAAMDDFNAIQRALSRGSGPAAIALRAAEKALESAGKEHALNNPLATRPNQYEIAAQEAGKAARAAEMETE